MPAHAATIVGPARVAVKYSEALMKDVKPQDFARHPKGVVTNHPAWVFGHLACYPDRAMLPLIGRTDLVEPHDDFLALFGARTECQDDPSGKIYPSMEAITTRYYKRTNAVIAVIAELSDDALAAPIPADHFLADRISNVGGVLNFMLTFHTMMHFGQISAWRRVMGLGPCM